MVETSPPQEATRTGSRRAFVAAAAALIVVTMGANMPLPLFPRYVDAYGLSALEVTSIFATYTLVIAPALLVFGPLSDAVGRRPVLVVALLAAASAAVVLGSAQSVEWLYVGRALQGLSVGAIQGSGAAALADTHPRGDLARAAVAGTIATCVATAVGPMTAGVLGQYLPAPLRLSFAVELALVAIALTALLAGFPSSPTASRRAIRMSWPSVPAAIRPAFLRATSSAVLAWAATALFLALSPTILRKILDTDNSVVSGGIVALMLVTSVLIQLGGRGRDHVTLQVVGLALLIVALGMFVAAASTDSVLLCGASAAVAGAGQGLAFSGSARAVSTIAPNDHRGNLMSLFFVAIYLGVTVAIVGLGLLSTRVGLLPAVQLFSVVASVGCLAGIVSQVRAFVLPR
ncbi:MFS family permease [Marmoricola sp. URHA0025 HA25]